MRLLFWIPLPLWCHLTQIYQRNAAYYLHNGHWYLYLINRLLPFMKVLSRIDKDSSIYFSKIHQTRLNLSIAKVSLENNLQKLARLTGQPYNATFEENEETEANSVSMENSASDLPNSKGSFASLDVLESDLTLTANGRLNNQRSTIEFQELPTVIPKPNVEQIQPNVLGSSLIAFGRKSMLYNMLIAILLIGEILVFEKILIEVFKISSNFNFSVIGIAIEIPKAILMAVIVPVSSLVLSYFIYSNVLNYLCKIEDKAFKRFYQITLIAIGYIFIANGILYYRTQVQASIYKDLVILQNKASSINEFDEDKVRLEALRQEIEVKQLEIKKKPLFFEIIKYLLIALYSLGVMITVSIVNTISKILNLRDSLLKAIKRDQSTIYKCFENEMHIHSDYKIHLGLVNEIKLKIEKIITLMNYSFNKNNRNYEN